MHLQQRQNKSPKPSDYGTNKDIEQSLRQSQTQQNLNKSESDEAQAEENSPQQQNMLLYSNGSSQDFKASSYDSMADNSGDIQQLDNNYSHPNSAHR